MKPAELRVFLSSTFTDLQPEREHLIKKVFPKIRAKCRERGVEFTEIDLRWGITAEEAHTGKIVRVCLGEIARCPYFIGILGSRYGWRPGITELEKDPAMLETYPMLRGYGEANKSITEIEFAHGALYPSVPGSAFIYEQVTPSQKIDTADSISMDELKDTIRSSGLPFRSFDTPEEFGDKVYNDLLFLLERDWPISAEPTPLESEQIAHRAFAFNRTRAYVASPEYQERFEQFVREDTPPLIVWGRSGLGKSALMAHLASEYERLHPEAFIVLHFVGASAGASSAADVMRRIASEIKLRYDLPDEVQKDDAALAQEFPSWLANIRTDDKLILFIDAVNQLSGIGPEMHWLPEFIPSNIRLILSTTPETPLEELRKRNWQELEIQPLGESARVQITTDYLASFGKKLTKEQIERVASEPKLESPLFLRTILEELRVFGVYESLEEHLAIYLSSEDEHELFQHVLARMERDFGSDAVRSVMTALWASRYGLTETELLEITQLPRYALSEFLIALEFHLMQRNGLYTFFHNYLRQAVEERYLRDEQKKKESHRHLAHYFADSPYNSRRRDEEPWQWKQAEEYARLREAISDLEMFRMLTHEEQRYEFSKYLPKDESMEDVESFFDLKITQKQNELSVDEQAILHYQLGDLLLTSANCIPAAKQLEKARALAETSTLPQQTIFTIYLQLCDALQQKGDYETARNQIERIMQDPKYGVSKDTPEYIKCLDLLGTLDNALGKYDLAEQKLTEALRLREQRKDIHVVELAHNYSNVASILSNSGRNEEALQYIEKALKYLHSAFGEDHIETAKLLANQGPILMRMKKLDEAKAVTEKAKDIYYRLVGEMNSETARVIQNLAVFAGLMGNHDSEEQLVRKAYYIRRQILGERHLETMISKFGIGRAWQRRDNSKEALKIYQECLDVFRRHMADSDPRISRLVKYIIEAEQDMDNYPQ